MNTFFTAQPMLWPLGWYFLSIVAVWILVWKGIALWMAARNDSKIWFIIMVVLNTFGILEIIYIFAVGRRKKHRRKKD
jgi:hypothetical protein